MKHQPFSTVTDHISVGECLTCGRKWAGHESTNSARNHARVHRHLTVVHHSREYDFRDDAARAASSEGT